MIMRVSSMTAVKSLAGALAYRTRELLGLYGVDPLEEDDRTILHCIGVESTYQAVKAVAIAQQYLMKDGIRLMVVPHWVDLPVEGKEVSGIEFEVRAEEIGDGSDAGAADGFAEVFV